jgi:hypothetical protein
MFRTLTIAMAVFFLVPFILYSQANPDPFRVLPLSPAPGPRITAYLRYQAEQAWRQDELRQQQFAGIADESDLSHWQKKLRERVLVMIGGLPESRSPLNAQVTGTLLQEGFHIERLIYESLPGFHVTALLYLPEPAKPRMPAILVACGHSQIGKAYYQTLCMRLVKRGYVVLCWDPVGQGERSQFWDKAGSKSRYNLACGEHAVLGNLAYLAGANLARWEIWDGMRGLDYLLSRPEVDPARVNITGTSGGGFQASHIAALDDRIHAAAPSCYISSLPMRMSNRIFKDPSSDPEQDLFGMLSEGVDHPGLLLLSYPRPVIVCAATDDFFPIEGARKTFREISDLYHRLGHSERIALTEGVHDHKFSDENQLAAFAFLDQANGMPPRFSLDPVKPLPEADLRCTRSGQVRLDYPGGKLLTELVREYYLDHKAQISTSLRQLYFGSQYPGIQTWPVVRRAVKLSKGEIAWEPKGSKELNGYTIDRYLLSHSEVLSVPLVYIHSEKTRTLKTLLWFRSNGKATVEDWPMLVKFLEQGYQIISWDARGLGEDRMVYKVASNDDPGLVPEGWETAYTSPLSGVLANYIYNSLLVGRPYYLQLMEDAEIVLTFARRHLQLQSFYVTAPGEAFPLAAGMAEVFPDVKLLTQSDSQGLRWSVIVEKQQENWPIQYLLPGGAYIR